MFLLVLVLVELTVRATRPRVASLDFLVDSREQQAQFVDARHVRIFEGDPLLFWRLTPNLRDVVWDLTPVTTNERGLRYDRMALAALRMRRFLETARSRAVTLLGLGLALATAAGLLIHSWTWRAANVESLLRVRKAVGEVQIVDPRLLPMSAGDHLYVATVRGSLAFSAGALLLVGWRLRRRQDETWELAHCQEARVERAIPDWPSQ